MAKKKQVVDDVVRPNAHWIISEEIQINGRNVVKGTELKISGERGRFRFVKHVLNGEIEWIDVHGGRKGAENMRSFRPDRVKTVHYKNKTGENLLAARKSS
jgi:hypothetical protein